MSAWCYRCQREFVSEQARYQHSMNHANHNLCTTCDDDFEENEDLIYHLIDVHDWYECEPCVDAFPTSEALHDHYSDFHPYCTRCKRLFGSEFALNSHNNAVHPLCTKCNVRLDNSTALEAHWTNSKKHHWCCLCRSHHDSDDALQQHRVNVHSWCIPCGRSFQNSNNLKQHQNSKHHTPKTFKCPLKDCSASFVSLSALIAHAENGGCVSGVTRRHVDRFAVAADVNGVFTEHRRIMGSPGAPTYPFNQETTYLASELAWNGRAYECYLCHGTFRQLKDLNAHLRSSKHTGGSNIYHCPPNGCGKKFGALSSLMRHIEDDSCGVRRFRFVKNTIEETFGQFSRTKAITTGGLVLAHGARP